MESSAPPAYSSPCRSPLYTAELGSNETRLAVTEGRTRRSPPSRIFTWRNDSITLSILGKEEGVASPIYGRRGVVGAEISMNSDPLSVMSVVVQLQGIMKLVIVDTISADVLVLNNSHTLWSKNDHLSPSSNICPGTLLFEDVLPLTHEGSGNAYELPPTYKAHVQGSLDLYVDCNYNLTVTITKLRDTRLWRSEVQEKLSAEIIYRPRARAYRSILSSPFPFSSTIKTVPEEWRQITSKMVPYPSQTHIEPIDCLLFIPAVQIYSLSDTIPVYLQLRGRVSSLRTFMHTPPPAASTLSSLFRPRIREPSPNPNVSPNMPPQPPPADAEQPIVRVFLSRQITVTVRGHRATKLITLGEATLRSIPPDATLSMTDHRSDDGYANLDWEGEVRYTQSETVGSFFTGQLLVKDHIVLHLIPPDPARSPLQEHRNSYPVRLVTDSFSEEPDPDA